MAVGDSAEGGPAVGDSAEGGPAVGGNVDGGLAIGGKTSSLVSANIGFIGKYFSVEWPNSTSAKTCHCFVWFGRSQKCLFN